MNYNYSFSGTDVKAYASDFEGKTFHLKALATISIQVNEQKSPVRRLGRQHVTGFTRSIKTVAGTMVFVILNDHPLKELIGSGNSYLNNRHILDTIDKKYHSTNILPFDLKLIYQTEHATNNTAEINVYGIEIISQSIVTSSNDMVTELVIQFLAKDYKEFYHTGMVVDNSETEFVRQEDILSQRNAEKKSDSVTKALEEVENLKKEEKKEQSPDIGQKVLNDYWGNKENSNDMTKSQRVKPEDVFTLKEGMAKQYTVNNSKLEIMKKKEKLSKLYSLMYDLQQEYLNHIGFDNSFSQEDFSKIVVPVMNERQNQRNAIQNSIDFVEKQIEKIKKEIESAENVK